MKAAEVCRAKREQSGGRDTSKGINFSGGFSSSTTEEWINHSSSLNILLLVRGRGTTYNFIHL
jgi:hypothetical protein